MFQLDDKFLEDIGLKDLPEDEKKAFLEHIYQELELRVGTKLSDGLSDEQLDEFEKIIDHNSLAIDNWLAENQPDYQSDPTFTKMAEASKLNTDSPKLKSEYVATKWLELNRPDYRKVVSQVLEELKGEITSNRDTIMDGGQA